MALTDPAVAIASASGGYPALFPFDPDERFPEYRGSVGRGVPNPVYRAVRKNFELLGYDTAHFGTPAWNPLGHLIRPGDSVFIKPNLCSHEYGRKKEKVSGDLFSIITHPSVVRAVADYVAIALKGRGEIVMGDNSTVDSNMAKLMEATGYDQFARFYPATFGVACSFLDLREMWCDDISHYGSKSRMKRLPGDPKGETLINLGSTSFFHGLNPLLFRGVFTDRRETIRHHRRKTQEYAIANSIYHSDVFISVPTLKTHHKVGATLNIKGLVGMCTRKNYLVHWRIGFPSWGGDEYPEPHRAVDHLLLALGHLYTDFTPEFLRTRWGKRLTGHPFAKMFHMAPYRGAWEGNDTCWRMAADLYLALMSRKRKCFSVVDGVVGGDRNGPFCPDRKEAGTIISGENLLLVDAVAIRMMDFDVRKIRYVMGLLQRLNLDLSRILILSDDYDVGDFFTSERSYLSFSPPSGWPHLPLRRTPTLPTSGEHP